MMRNTPRAISAACALVDAAKNDLEKYGDEQKQAIQHMIETCITNLLPAVRDLQDLIFAMVESENDYSLQLEKHNYHYRIGQEVLDELTQLLEV